MEAIAIPVYRRTLLIGRLFRPTVRLNTRSRQPPSLFSYQNKHLGLLLLRTVSSCLSGFKHHCIHTCTPRMTNPNIARPEDSGELFKCVEVLIPVPWGNLAAKVWGEPNSHPVLALHGWQDNAGTFDRLIPLLPPDSYVVCLDFSGHGLSSHYPPGLMYHYWDHITHVRLVAAHFKWNRFSIMGHSLGGIVGSMFAAIFPDLIEKLVMIDIVKPVSYPAQVQPDKSAKAINSYMQVMHKLQQPPPSYTYEGAKERLLAANNGSLDSVGAEVLMRRGTKQLEDQTYVFSRDLRLVIPSVSSYTAEQHAQYARRVRCPVLLIKANQGFVYEDKAVIEEFVKIYEQASLGGFQHVQVDGTHHVHLVNPENVAAIISTFLSFPEHDEAQSISNS